MIQNEDRAHQRFAVHLIVQATSTSRSVERVGTMTDVGLGGAALELDLPLRHGESINLVILPSNAEGALSPHGIVLSSVRVVWIAWGEGSCVRIGVAFTQQHAVLVAPLLAQQTLLLSQQLKEA